MMCKGRFFINRSGTKVYYIYPIQLGYENLTVIETSRSIKYKRFPEDVVKFTKNLLELK